MLGREAFIHPKRIYTQRTIKKYQKGIRAIIGAVYKGRDVAYLGFSRDWKGVE